MTTQFQAGKSYWTRSIGDADCIITLAVLRRTAKTVTVRDNRGERSLRITERDGVETVKPWGTYSMCPVVKADRPGEGR